MNLVSFNSQGKDLVEKILPKPALYPVYAATYVIFTSARTNTAVFAVGIRTRHNHFWLQQLQSLD